MKGSHLYFFGHSLKKGFGDLQRKAENKKGGGKASRLLGGGKNNLFYLPAGGGTQLLKKTIKQDTSGNKAERKETRLVPGGEPPWTKRKTPAFTPRPAIESNLGRIKSLTPGSWSKR